QRIGHLEAQLQTALSREAFLRAQMARERGGLVMFERIFPRSTGVVRQFHDIVEIVFHRFRACLQHMHETRMRTRNGHESSDAAKLALKRLSTVEGPAMDDFYGMKDSHC